MSNVEIKGKHILLDGKPTQIVSGAIHYFRVHPALWDDRLDKAVAFGLNAVETYVAWNLHEPQRGEFNFTGIADLEMFIDKVQAHGLMMILRPGPFICAEWENGGFPSWLNALPGVKLRRMNKPYLDAVEGYFSKLLPKLRPRLATRGGPIILVSIENEYGSYCHDKEYLSWLAQRYQENGIDVPLFTNDGPKNHHLLGGTLPEKAMVSMDFGSNSESAWENKEKLFPNTPDFCMEFWDGWFDHWSDTKHRTRVATGSPDSAAAELERILKAGASVNLYMFHGGTNFGFLNGANGEDFDTGASNYQPTTTSYDYDSPLSECGDPTEKFFACQRVIANYVPNPRIAAIKPTKKVKPFSVELQESAALFENLERLSVRSGKFAEPPTMEELGQSFGFIHYRKRIEGPLHSASLRLYGVNDRAQVWLDGRYLGCRLRADGRNPFVLEEVGKDGAVLDLLVENCGRINYGPHLGRDFKGITQAVTIEYQTQLDWECHSLPLERLDGLKFGEFNSLPGAAIFHRAQFTVEEVGDAFLRRPGVKGAVWINGFNLGRYWNVGPTETLYVPAPVLRQGVNEAIILELESLDSKTLHFENCPDLGPIE